MRVVRRFTVLLCATALTSLAISTPAPAEEPLYTAMKVYAPACTPSAVSAGRSCRLSGVFFSEDELGDYSDPWLYVRVQRASRGSWSTVRTIKVRPRLVSRGHTVTFGSGEFERTETDCYKYYWTAAFATRVKGSYRAQAVVNIREGDEGVTWRATKAGTFRAFAVR